MGTDFHAVEPHFSLIVYGSEVEQNAFSFPGSGNRKRPPVPQGICSPHLALHARERRLHRKRNEYLPVVIGGLSFRYGTNGIIPLTVEIQPAVAHQGRARILRERARGVDVRRPSGLDPVSGGLPGSGIFGAREQQGGQGNQK